VAIGETTAGPEAVLLQIFVPFRPDQVERPWRGIVTGTHTYARFEEEPWLLFDRTKDPDELHNLVGDADAAELQRQLDRQLSELMRKNGDAWSFNSMELVEEGGRLYRHETFYTLEEYRAWAKEHPERAP